MTGKIYSFLIAFVLMQLVWMEAHTQNTFPGAGAVGIGTLTPNASSLLDVTSTSKGILVPRMTKAQRDLIATPATGLLIYQLNATPGFYYYNGTAWTAVSAAGGANKTLSNLQPTSITQSLNPSTDNIRDLGTSLLRWNEVYSSKIISTSADTPSATITATNSFLGDGDAVAVEAIADANAVNGFGIGVSASGGFIGNLGSGFIGNYGIGNFGVVGEALDTVADWAGYFLGDLLASNYYIPSDAKLKNNTELLSGSLEKIMQLNPMSYSYKTSEYKGMHLPAGTQMGLIADEVQAVFPQMVKESYSPESRNNINGTDAASVTYKSVNYIALIPVLISAMQEQQTTIEAKDEEIKTLQDQNASLESRIRAIESALSMPSPDARIHSLERASLEQNAPNPFREKTTIRYSIPVSATSAMIKVFSLNGVEVKTLNIASFGEGSVELTGGSLVAGTYTYQLIIDGKTIDTKLMVLTN